MVRGVIHYANYRICSLSEVYLITRLLVFGVHVTGSHCYCHSLACAKNALWAPLCLYVAFYRRCSAWMAGVSIPMGYSAYMISVQNAQLYEKYVCDDQMSVPNITKV